MLGASSLSMSTGYVSLYGIYNTFVTVLITVELSNKESHFIRVILELQGESKSPPNKRCQLVVLTVAGLLRVTLVNYNQIQN